MELNTNQILELIHHDQYSRQNFIGVFPRNFLPKRLKYPCSFIINTDPADKEGQHWLAFYFDQNKHCEFFDSYGNSPLFYKLEKYIFEHSLSSSFNHTPLQSNFSRLCGYYCCLFIFFRSRGLKLDDLLETFGNSQIVNDLTLYNVLNKKF